MNKKYKSLDDMEKPITTEQRRKKTARTLSSPSIVVEHKKDYVEPTWDDLFLGEDEPIFISFREFCYQRHTSENLSFLIAVAKYRLMLGSKARQMMAEQIIIDYIRPEAESSIINITGKERQRIIQKAQEHTDELSRFGETFFDGARQEITKVLRTDTFPDFIDSLCGVWPRAEDYPEVTKPRRGTLDNYRAVRTKNFQQRRLCTIHEVGESSD